MTIETQIEERIDEIEQAEARFAENSVMMLDDRVTQALMTMLEERLVDMHEDLRNMMVDAMQQPFQDAHER